MAKKRLSQRNSWVAWLKEVKVEDVLLVVVGILVLMIVLLVSHYSFLGEEFPSQILSMTPLIYYFDIFVKKTTFKYVFFVLIPLLVVWIAKLFQRKTWDIRKSMMWLGIGIVIMLLIYFIAPSKTGFENIPQAENPDVKLFIMAFCPFGQQAESALKPIQELFGNQVVIEPHFIINDLSAQGVQQSGCIKDDTLCSLHGVNELTEDIRQICIWKYYPSEWWDYVSCINANCDADNVETCWQGCADDNDIIIAKIRACEKLEGIELAENDRDLGEQLKAYSSPTFFINNASYQGEERTPEMFKKAICKGFINPPSECETKLTGNAETSQTSQDDKENNEEKFIIKAEIDMDKCTEEGVCPKTGEKAVINETG